MPRTLRVLHVEDSERDAALLIRHLTRSGYDLISERVETPEAMKAALASNEWDVIFCDYSMPHFSSLSALALLKEMGLDIPFVIISGTIGEDVAVEAMRAGANDYLMKDNLVRLAPTIERELHEAENRRALRQAEALYRRLIDTTFEGVWIFDAEMRTSYVNQRLTEMLGVNAEEMIGKSPLDFVAEDSRADLQQRLERRKQGIKEQYDLHLRREDGSELWVIACATPILGSQGEFTGSLSMLTDITERRRAEQLVRLQATALESADNAILITGNDGTITWVNSAFATLTGYAPEEVLGRNPRILKSGRHKPAFFESMWKTLLSGQVWHGEIINRRKDGSVYVEEQTITPVLDETGEITNFIAIKQDITDRKKAEEEKAQLTTQIENQRQRLDNIVASVPGVVWEAWGDPDAATQRIDFVSEYVETMLGYSVEEWLSTPNFWLSIVHPDDRARAARTAAADFPGGKSNNTMEFRWVTKDGRVLWAQSNSAVVMNEEDRPVGLRGVTIDITERKRAEEAQRESEERYRLLFASNPLPMWVYDLETLRFLEVNAAAVQRYGYSQEEFLLMTIKDIRPPKDVPALLANVSRVATGLDEAGIWKHRKKDGQIIEVEITSHELIFAGRRAELVLPYDITERLRIEEMRTRRVTHVALRADVTAALAMTDSDLQRILERCTEAIVQQLDAAFARIWTLNQDGNVLELQASSGMYTQIDGSHARVAVGAFKIGLIAKERQPHITNEVQTDARVNDKEWAKREGMIAFAGYPLLVEDRLVGVMAMFARRSLADDTLDALASVADIISQGIERKRFEEALGRSEEQLRQAQKMEAIGQLAGGIAHDFNNLLTVITGYSELSIRRLPVEDPLRKNIEEIKKAGDRAAALTRQLLAFSRKQVLQPKVLDLNAVISELEKMLRRLIGEDIELRTVLETGLGSVKADPGQIEQIIMNLVVNARDVMPQGGKLTIETKNMDLDEGYASQHIAVSPGPYVMLAVTDTGTGMDEQTQARIFEPFFTTKDAGKGTGLGLSTVYGIVKQSDGLIWVYSEVGKGTTFKIYLPLVSEGVQDYERGAEGRAPIRGKETILLAEDEEMVRKLAVEVLESYGYLVLVAANGGAALLICERHKEPIQLLITDVVMPEMSGRELSDRLALLRPEMKVLYMSGYTDNAIVHQGVLDEGANFIQKPFSPNSLARKVREILDADD